MPKVVTTMSAKDFDTQDPYDPNDVGEVYTGEQDIDFEFAYRKAFSDLYAAAMVIKWYAKNGYCDCTDMRGPAQEFLQERGGAWVGK